MNRTVGIGGARDERLATKRMNRRLNCKSGFVAPGRAFSAHTGILLFRLAARHFSPENRTDIPVPSENAAL